MRLSNTLLAGFAIFLSGLLPVSASAMFVANTFYTEKCPFITYSMVVGSTDADTEGQVTKLQDFLRLQNRLSKPSTGYFGPATLSAVAKWQKYMGFSSQIKNKGTVGPKTKEAMNALCTVGVSAEPVLGNVFYTPNKTPTVRAPLNWNSRVDLDMPLGSTTKMELRTVVAFIDPDLRRVLSYSIFAVPDNVDSEVATASILDSLSIAPDTKLLSSKNLELYGLEAFEVLQETKTTLPNAGYSAKTSFITIPGFIIALSGASDKARTPEFDVLTWQKKAFDSIMLPSIFNDSPNGVPINEYILKYKMLTAKIENARQVKQGVESDFYLSYCYNVTANLNIGSTDKETNGQVSQLQKMLYEKYMIPSTNINGYFDDLTLLQTIRFQREMGLEGAGGVAVKTRAALNRCRVRN